MRKSSLKERRMHVRAQFRGVVSLDPVLEHRAGNCLEVKPLGLRARAKEVSEGGIQLKVKKTRFPLKWVLLQFTIPKIHAVQVYGRRIWSRNGVLGFSYVGLDPKDRHKIQKYVQKTSPDFVAVGQRW